MRVVREWNWTTLKPLAFPEKSRPERRDSQLEAEGRVELRQSSIGSLSISYCPKQHLKKEAFSGWNLFLIVSFPPFSAPCLWPSGHLIGSRFFTEGLVQIIGTTSQRSCSQFKIELWKHQLTSQFDTCPRRLWLPEHSQILNMSEDLFKNIDYVREHVTHL